MNITRQKNKVQFKAYETATAWVVVAIAWKNVSGKIVYSEPKIVRIIPKPETSLTGQKKSHTTDHTSTDTLLLRTVSVSPKTYFELIVSPYSFSYTEERTGSITWYGARPPTFF